MLKSYHEFDDEESDDLGNNFERADNVDFAGDNISSSSDTDDETDVELDDKTPNVATIMDDRTPLHVSRDFLIFRKFWTWIINYCPLTAQEYSKFDYSNPSKCFQLEYETFWENNCHNSGRLSKRNILQNIPGLRNTARSLDDPLESFSLFIPNSLIETIV